MDFPKYNLRETGVIGLTNEGKQWLTDFVKEACDMLGLTFTARVIRSSRELNRHGEREYISFRPDGIDFNCYSQFLDGSPFNTLFLLFKPHSHAISFHTVVSREAALHKLMCAIIAACPERFLEQIKASVVK
jgi:hypothetical protein